MQKRKIPIYLCSAMFIGIGVLMLYFGARTVIIAKRCANWPSVEGTIVQNSAYTEPSAGRIGSSGTVGHYLTLRYDYEVAGTHYTGSWVEPSGLRNTSGNYKCHSEEDQTRYLEMFPVGKKVPVYYDETNPSSSLLIREYPVVNTYLIIGMAVCILFFGVMILFLKTKST